MIESRSVPLALLLLALSVTPALAGGADDAGGDAAVVDKIPSWLARTSFYGTLRLRHENIHEDGNPDANRNRERGLARAGVKAAVTDKVTVTLGIATGGDDPVSRNVTGDGGFTTKEIGFEFMYVEWRATDTINVYAGKMKNPLFRAGKAPLIWDSDLNPEGIAVTYKGDLFFGNVGSFSVEERSGADDSTLIAAQAGVAFDALRNLKVTAGVGYFGYSNTVGNEPFYDGSPNGNTVDANGDYVFDYRNFEVFTEVGTKLAGWPLKLFGQYTWNTEVDRQETAWAVGARVGSTDARGDMQFGLLYEDIGADAVIGTFNDSDFGGGGTDSDGYVVKGEYMLTDNIGIGATVFYNTIDRFQGTAHDFDRVQLDLEFKFE